MAKFKIPVIHACYQCYPYYRHQSEIRGHHCMHPENMTPANIDGKEIDDFLDIPDWCPLPDAKEAE